MNKIYVVEDYTDNGKGLHISDKEIETFINENGDIRYISGEINMDTAFKTIISLSFLTIEDMIVIVNELKNYCTDEYYKEVKNEMIDFIVRQIG